MGAAACSTGVKLQPDAKTKTPSQRRTGLERAMQRNPARDRQREEGKTMWLIYLEAGIALTVVLAIVYWTMRGKK
jgi:hypothetical protein